MKIRDIRITDPFWLHYRSIVRHEMIPYQWKVLNDEIDVRIERERDDPSIPNEKSHALENFRIAAGVHPGHHYGWVFQDSDVYLALCSVYRNAELNDSQFELLLERTDLPAVKKALAANNTIAFRFLEGEWREPHGQHFDFSDGHIIRDDFPRVVWEGGYVDIEDGVIRRYTDAHTTPREDKAFQVISRDQIALFCYVDGRTYTLNRKA